jgi:DNA-binding MarR family transcriptional regulator
VHDRARAQRLAHSQRIEATVFLYDIVVTAERLKAARAFDGSTPLRFDRRYTLLRALERCGGCPSFSDLARLLRVTRQAARQLILAAEKDGVVELLPDPQDRRVLQVALTPSGRRVLEGGRTPETGWLFTLLSGLEPAAMHAIGKVLRVIRQRLERYAAEMRAAGAPRRRQRPRD